MKKASVLLVLVAFVLVGVWQYRTSHAQVAVESELRIGVVNVAKVLGECQEKLDRERETEARSQKIKESLDKLGAEAESLQKELEQALMPNTDEYRRVLQQFYDKSALYKAYGEGQKKAMEHDARGWLDDIYGRLLKQIGTVARQEKLSLVLNLDDLPLEGRDLGELYNVVLSRSVLYNSPMLDITAQLVENMDNQYEQMQSMK